MSILGPREYMINEESLLTNIMGWYTYYLNMDYQFILY
jgi:hypothetical protein